MPEKEMITDKEWAEFLKEEYRQVCYCLPSKDATEKYLRWKEKRRENLQ